MKKLLFGLIATAFLGVLSVNAQSKPTGYAPLNSLRFGKISSYAGPCVDGGGMCSGSIIPDALRFESGVAKISENTVSYAFTREFYAANLQYISNGLSIEVPYSLPQSVSSALGFTGEFVVAPDTYQVMLRDGFYFIYLNRM